MSVLYRDVQTLCELGFDAVVVHFTEGFRYPWSEAQVPVITLSSLPDNPPGAIFVVPETYGPDLHQFIAHEGIRVACDATLRVIYNQNYSLTFVGYPPPYSRMVTPYMASGTLGCITVSRHGEAFLRHLFPALPVWRKPNAIDADMFFPPPGGKPGNQIAFMSRKHGDEVNLVLHALQLRGALRGLQLVDIHDCTPHQVAESLRESSLFLSFGYPEGFSLPPAEAMACGCYVVGYSGHGGNEYFRDEFALRVSESDMYGFVRAAERITDELRANPAAVHARGLQAAAYIHRHYSRHSEIYALQAIWEDVFLAADREMSAFGFRVSG